MNPNTIILENTYRQLPTFFYQHQQPNTFLNPKIAVLNETLVSSLGMNKEYLTSSEGIAFLSGNHVLENMTPLSQAYAGHQFGHFTMLGDGRAVLLGEYVTSDKQRYDLQLKGAGPTVFSRGGDGKAALGPMLREYLISEAMANLGIPTTRSLAIIATGEKIERESILDGAILVRLASSHIRVGTFQYAAKWGMLEDLRALADYAIYRHFPEIIECENIYIQFLESVVQKQAILIAQWQLVGFVHGVMNTDNMTISGETIDYGPCAFMDSYDENTVFSSIDYQGRYAYGNQPNIGGWNLARLAESLVSLIHEDREIAIDLAQSVLSKYGALYHLYWLAGMRKKLGLFTEEREDIELIQQLLTILKEKKADYTNTFKDLTLDNVTGEDWYESISFQQWYQSWQERLQRQSNSKEEIMHLMQANNPVVIPRNYLVEDALLSVTSNNDWSNFNELVAILKNPYDYSKVKEKYTSNPPASYSCYKTYCGT